MAKTTQKTGQEVSEKAEKTNDAYIPTKPINYVQPKVVDNITDI